jgi:2-(1,2-epoxy-1,2-dihydrophenyl)acetyl-CoA isomerase
MLADGSLRVEHDGGVLEITIDRADRRNAIDEPTARRLTGTLQEAGLDPSVRSVLITGVGRHFCTGADIFASGDQAGTLSPLDFRMATRHFYAMNRTMWEMEKPVVSAVNGTVAGAGWSLALMGDLVVAAREARWTHVFLRRGMVPHAGDTYFLPRLLPLHKLNELALLSDTVTSEDLDRLGVVNRLVETDQVLSVARELAGRLAAGPTQALGLTKRMYRNSINRDMETVFEEERSATALISTTEDRREGVRSFVENRPPNFLGR